MSDLERCFCRPAVTEGTDGELDSSSSCRRGSPPPTLLPKRASRTPFLTVLTPRSFSPPTTMPHSASLTSSLPLARLPSARSRSNWSSRRLTSSHVLARNDLGRVLARARSESGGGSVDGCGCRRVGELWMCESSGGGAARRGVDGADAEADLGIGESKGNKTRKGTSTSRKGERKRGRCR